MTVSVPQLQAVTEKKCIKAYKNGWTEKDGKKGKI